ncbi:MAG: AraC family transcriptional regulator [Deltaproteobacteria bacterium]|nr:AraC family transcriptional regulator [Deltaproteobacteria bacterium]
MPIKTIAHTLGFDTPSNFTRSFKHWTGTSPSAFRRHAHTDAAGRK